MAMHAALASITQAREAATSGKVHAIEYFAE